MDWMNGYVIAFGFIILAVIINELWRR